jgi:hypothetical protein
MSEERFMVPFMKYIVSAMTLDHIIATVDWDSIVALDTIIAFVILLVALLTDLVFFYLA